ncbi:M48 family metallopeptidase [Candidatus Pantoea multigeneris]|uniref:M48 family metalloprotease n=1 Tax=Candidatus Pantoea multigeneris TaxID=2608357 RepID=A0ABX0REC4_9GAMM|nr:M48 family metallopeptidase [Pantoea multigeneris]NIF23701.1 M48 family metalloprotease [Pantoea multigeneris]
MKKGFSRILIYLLLSLFLIPITTLIFTEYGSHKFGNEVASIIIDNARKQNQDVTEVQAFLDEHPPQSVCVPVDSDLQDYQNSVCPLGSELWQFHAFTKLSVALIVFGVFILLLIAALSGLAFVGPAIQAISLRLARPILILVTLIEVLVQGVLLVWLSFWITAFFTNSYFPKLILLIGLAVVVGIFCILKGIFRRLPPPDDTEGIEVTRTHAPALWARLGQLAARLGTTAPDHVIAGIDASFYVTEAPLSVKKQKLRGRKLYVSLPLLRHLTPEQADGVMIHELTHLQKGDTASSAALGPKLHHLDLYIELMGENPFTLAVYYPLAVYRMLFELAWQRYSRDREFIADRKAAEVAGPATIVESLVKISAYSAYWGEVEHEMFARNERHEETLNMRDAIAKGLTDYAHSDGFTSMMREQNVPHPFDSHPPLSERMQSVGHVIDERDFAAVATLMPQHSWVDLVPHADEIEQTLWQRYESDFSSAHEESLSWRYEPVGEEQIALVEKYFPSVTYKLRKGREISVGWQGVTEPKHGKVWSWDEIRTATFNSMLGITYVIFYFHEKQDNGKKVRMVFLPGIRKKLTEFSEDIGKFLYRHQVMREQQKNTES